MPIKGTINNACLTLNMAHKLFGQKREKKLFESESRGKKKYSQKAISSHHISIEMA